MLLHADDRAKPIAQDLRQMLRIARAHLEHQAVVAGDVMDFEHFWNGRKLICHAHLAGTIGRPYGDEREKSLIERSRIDLGDVTDDDALGFQLAQPLEHGRWGETHRSGNFNLRKAGVVLQQANDFDIDGIEHGAFLSP